MKKLLLLSLVAVALMSAGCHHRPAHNPSPAPAVHQQAPQKQQTHGIQQPGGAGQAQHGAQGARP